MAKTVVKKPVNKAKIVMLTSVIVLILAVLGFVGCRLFFKNNIPTAWGKTYYENLITERSRGALDAAQDITFAPVPGQESPVMFRTYDDASSESGRSTAVYYLVGSGSETVTNVYIFPGEIKLLYSLSDAAYVYAAVEETSDGFRLTSVAEALLSAVSEDPSAPDPVAYSASDFAAEFVEVHSTEPAFGFGSEIDDYRLRGLVKSAVENYKDADALKSDLDTQRAENG